MIANNSTSKDDLQLMVCHSEEIDTEDAIHELIKQGESKLDGAIPDACILFSAIDYEHQIILDEINKKWEGIKLIGGTTDGEMSSELGFAEDSIVMILFKSNTTKFTVGVGDSLSGGIEEACKHAVEQASAELETEAKLCFTVPGSFVTNIDHIAASLKKLLNENTPIFGGVPGDQWRFKTQYQFCGNKIFTDAVPILLFSGDFLFEYGINSGWEPMGEIGVANKAEGNIVYEINNQPAIEFYKKVLGELSEPSGEFPIVVLDDKNEIMYQRTSAKVMDDNSGAIIFIGEIPQGSKVQIANAKRETILEGTKKSISQAIEKLPEKSKITGCIFVSCAARKALLGTQTENEMKIASDILGKDIPCAGFYSYGEISPLKNEPTNSMLHNQTFVTLLFGK